MSDEDEISDNQWKANYVIQCCSALVSVVGSLTLIFKILRDRAQNGSTKPYDRMILGLSSCDILSSITITIDQFLFRSATDIWSFGTPASCKARGFLLQLAPAWAIWYNGLLSYYFLLTVLSQMRRKNYVQTFEPWLHVSGLFFPITAIMGLILGWYPEDDPCRISDWSIVWMVQGIPLFFVLLSLLINYSTIYGIVRKTMRPTEQVLQQRRRKQATIQMFSYVGAFFITVAPAVILAVLETNFGYTGNERQLYPLWILNSILLPLQGLFNFLIYLKPVYTRVRTANPNASMSFVLHQALFNTETPRSTYNPRIANAVTEEDVGSVTDTNNCLIAVHNRRNAVTAQDLSGILAMVSDDESSDVEAKGSVTEEEDMGNASQ